MAAHGDSVSIGFAAAAASVEVIGDGTMVSTGSIALASLVAKGMAIDKAQRMESRSLSMQVIDENSPVPSADIIVRFPRTAAVPAMPAIGQSTVRMLVAGKTTELGSLVGEAAIMVRQHGQDIVEFQDFSAATDAIGRASAAAVTAAAHLVVVPENDETPEAELARTARMVRSAPAGSVVASRDAAMAVKSRTAGTWLEPLGELPDMEGGADHVCARYEKLATCAYCRDGCLDVIFVKSKTCGEANLALKIRNGSMQESQMANCEKMNSDAHDGADGIVSPDRMQVVQFAPPTGLAPFVTQIYFFNCEEPYISDLNRRRSAI